MHAGYDPQDAMTNPAVHHTIPADTHEHQGSGRVTRQTIRQWAAAVVEPALLMTLSGFAVSLYLTRDVSPWLHRFSIASAALLLLWRFVIRYEPVRQIPKSLVIFTVLFFFSLLLSALISHDKLIAFFRVKEYLYFILGGLIFTAPLTDKYRKILIVVFFISAAVDGLWGILQHFDVMPKDYDRSHGLTLHPAFHASKLAFVFGTATLFLFAHKRNLFQSLPGKAFLVLTLLLTFGGTLLSQSRSVWIALFVACFFALYLYDQRKAIYFSLSLAVILVGVFTFSNPLRQRAASIVTSFFTEDSNGSTGTRIQLWKGALLIFAERPLIGVGSGNYQEWIAKLIEDGKVQQTNQCIENAHNIFLHTLATQGLVGLGILIALLASLLRWSFLLMKTQQALGGYVLLFCTLLLVVEGMADYNLGMSKFLITFYFTLGVIVPYGMTQTKTSSE